MLHEEAKREILGILDSAVSFEGHFDKCFDNLKESQQEEILLWVRQCRLERANPIKSSKDREIIEFVKRIGSNIRAILTKEKKGYFLVLFLDMSESLKI